LELQASVMDLEANKLLAEGVREAVRASLSKHRCLTGLQCATELGISVRSMQRRLKTIDLSFSTIVNEIRYDLARAQLLHCSDTIEEIGRALGFSTQESFIRAFTRWSDMSPGEFRRQSSS
jgi:AraC-like DNA-binding protein